MTGYPPTRAYRTRVSLVERLAPHFVRITVTGEDLIHFGTGGLDQRIKLLFATEGVSLPGVEFFARPMMEWYREWRLLPPGEKGSMRTYTVRAVRPAAQEIDIDFVLHGTEGPASIWAAAARPGDELLVLGPDARSTTAGGGIEWRPGSARTVLLAGDETAVPAIGAILESLDDTFAGQVYLEVPEKDDALPFAPRSGIEVTWLAREGAGHGELLDAAVRSWGRGVAGATSATPDDPDPELAPDDPSEPASDPGTVLWEVPDEGAGAELYAWLAGEAGTITRLRRHLVKDLGIDRRSVAFMGYWKRGRAEGE